MRVSGTELTEGSSSWTLDVGVANCERVERAAQRRTRAPVGGYPGAVAGGCLRRPAALLQQTATPHKVTPGQVSLPGGFLQTAGLSVTPQRRI